MKPSDCLECRVIFLHNIALQAEVRQIAVRYGEKAAQAEVDERLEDYHVDHESFQLDSE